MDATTLLTTTRSVRKRLDLNRPVPRELLLECLQEAVQAPTGSNRQGWHWVFVTDPQKRAQIGEHYRKSWYQYAASGRAEYPEGDSRRDRMPHVISSAQYLADHMGEVPVLVIGCHLQRCDHPGATSWEMAGLYGSILPAAWSFMLAARARGLGSTWTTLHLRYEREVADLLGIPYEKVTQAVLIPVAYYTGDEFKPAARIPLDGIVHWDAW